MFCFFRMPLCNSHWLVLLCNHSLWSSRDSKCYSRVTRALRALSVRKLKKKYEHCISNSVSNKLKQTLERVLFPKKTCYSSLLETKVANFFSAIWSVTLNKPWNLIGCFDFSVASSLAGKKMQSKAKNGAIRESVVEKRWKWECLRGKKSGILQPTA